ncbi:hypothetical protein [Clostridium sp.]|uniref:hypothetical protein n=1 Tax=Clostridium sp. TaxID=1506 RepID=UPI001DB9E2EC|nr:hypothetical protein [Clostridium sp.]MBS5986574.1 hypothetical protein [Clostridium sp.]
MFKYKGKKFIIKLVPFVPEGKGITFKYNNIHICYISKLTSKNKLQTLKHKMILSCI